MAEKKPTEGNKQTSEEQKKSSENVAENTVRGLTDKHKKALQTSFQTFLSQQKKNYKDVDEKLIDLFLAWNRKHEKDSLLRDLTSKDLEQISVDMESILESNYQKKLQAKTQKALVGTYISSVRSILGTGNLFEKKIQKAFENIFSDDAILDVSLFQSTLQKFLEKYIPSMSSEQKKLFDRVGSIRITDVLRTLRSQKLVSDEELSDMDAKGLIVANNDVKDIVQDILSYVIIPHELSEMDNDKQKESSVVNTKLFSRVPGLNELISSYDFSPANLADADADYQGVMDNPKSSDDAKIKAAVKAMAKFVNAKDKKLGGLMLSLIDKNFQLAACSREDQQYYLNAIKDTWLSSKEGKEITGLFASLNVSEERKKNLLDQMFDLGKDSLTLTNNAGDAFTLPLKKYFSSKPISVDSLSDQLNFPLPLIFELDGKSFSGTDEYSREKILRLLGTHKEAEAFERNGIRIVPGNELSIKNKLDKTNDMSAYKYARRDPEGNILLYKTPGSNMFVSIDKADIGNYEIQIEKPTYHLTGSSFPMLVSLLMQAKHASELTPEQQAEAIKEWNDDYAKDVIKDDFGKHPEHAGESTNEQKDARLASVNWNDEASIASLSKDEVDYAQQTVATDLSDVKKEKKDAERNLKNARNSIARLEQEIADLDADDEKNQKKIQRLKQQLEKKQLEVAQLENSIHDLDNEIINLSFVQEKINAEADRRAKELIDNPVSIEQTVEKAVDVESVRKSFNEDWKNLYGDESLSKPQVGQVLMCQLADAMSIFPGATATWVQGEIVNVDKDGIDVRRTGVEGKISEVEGQTSRIPAYTENPESANGLQDFIKSFGKVYKMPKNTDLVSWGLKLKDPNSKWKLDKKYADWLKMMQQKVDFSSMIKQKVDSKDPTEDIKYFGATVGDEKLWYKVEFDGKYVTIVGRDRNDKIVKQNMDLNGFMIFAAEKGLNPFSQEDVDRANGADNHPERKGLQEIVSGKDSVGDHFQAPSRKGNRWQRNMISMYAVASNWKDLKSSVNTYFEERKKKDAGRAKNRMLKSDWFKAAKKLPFGVGSALDEMGAGIDAKLNTEKTKKINEYKEEVDKNKSDGGSGGTKYIEEALFKDDKEMVGNPHKAAGYFLWALENGGPYIRSLGAYEKDAMWVKAILGPDAVSDYRQYLNRMKAEALTNPEAALAVEKGELGFLIYYFQVADSKVKDSLMSVYGEKFFGGTLGAAPYNLWYNKSKIDEEYKGESAKPFSDIAIDAVYNDRSGDYFSYITQDRIRNHIAATKAMAEKVGPSDPNYKKWMAAMIIPYLTGKTETKMAEPFQDEFKSIGKKTAFPFTQYTSDPRAQYKVTRILDILSKDFVNNDGNPGHLTANLKASDVKTQGKEFFDWWMMHADSMLKIINDPASLIRIRESYRTKPGENDQQKMNTFTILDEFIEDKIQDSDAGMFNDDLAGDSRIMESHIFNATTGLVSSQMTKASNGSFTGAALKNGQKLWESMNNKIRNIDREVESLKNDGDKDAAARIYAYTMKNFFRQFGEKLNGEQSKRDFLIALHHYEEYKKGVDIDLLQLVVRGKYDTKMNGDALPDVMSQGLKIYEGFFLRHKDLIRHADKEMNWDLLEVAVGKESNWKKIYYEEKADKLATSAIGRKELMKKVKTFQSFGMDAPDYFTNEDEEDDDDDDEEEYGRRAA